MTVIYDNHLAMVKGCVAMTVKDRLVAMMVKGWLVAMLKDGWWL